MKPVDSWWIRHGLKVCWGALLLSVFLEFWCQSGKLARENREKAKTTTCTPKKCEGR